MTFPAEKVEKVTKSCALPDPVRLYLMKRGPLEFGLHTTLSVRRCEATMLTGSAGKA